MLRLRIGKMRLHSAEFVLLLLCIFLLCVEARPGVFRRTDGSRAEMIERLSLLQRKILQDQYTPISTESGNGKVEETVQQVEQKWEPKAEEKREWIRETPVSTESSNVKVEETVQQVEQKWEPKAEEKREWIKETPISTESSNGKVEETVLQVEQQWEPKAEEKREWIRETPISTESSNGKVEETVQQVEQKWEPKAEEKREWIRETPISTESSNGKVEETVQQVEQKWEPKAEENRQPIRETQEDEVAKAEEKREWIREAQEDEVAKAEDKKEWIRETQEDEVAKAEEKRELVRETEEDKVAKAEEKREPTRETEEDEGVVGEERKADRGQTTLEENNEAWHQDTKEEIAPIKMEEKERALYQEREAEGADITLEEEEPKLVAKVAAKTDDKSENQGKSDNEKKNPLARKVEEWMETKVEEKKGEQISVDEKKEVPKMEERRDDAQVYRPNEDTKELPEESNEFMVEDRKRISVAEKTEELEVEEMRNDPQVYMKDMSEVDERKESVVEDREQISLDRQVEPLEGVKEVTKVEEQNVDSRNPDDRKQKNLESAGQTNLGENNARAVEDKKWEGQVEEEALKVQDKKEEIAQVGLKYDDKDKDENSSTPSKIDKDEPVLSRHQEDPHRDVDDDYPDFLDELRNFPERLQNTAKSVKDHIKDSGLDRYSTHSKELFNQANQQIEQSFTPLLGKDYAPFLAYFVSYGLLLLPLALVTCLLDRIRASYSLQKILLFFNIYLSIYFATLLVVALILGSEPMSFFMKYSSSSYIFLQLLQGFGFVVYLLLTTAELISTCSNGRITAKFSSLLQWVVVVAVGFHYYVTVFHRAMARKAPLTGWKIYGLYSIAFVFLCLFARIERGKKHYISVEVDDTTDKKN